MGVWSRLFGELSKGGLVLSALVAVLGVAASVFVYRAGQRELGLCLAGFTSLLASPISWSHHYVWVVPLAFVLLRHRSLPRWLRIVGGVYCLWIIVGPFKFLAGGNGEELRYGLAEHLVDDGGVALGVAFLVLALVWGVRAVRRPLGV